MKKHDFKVSAKAGTYSAVMTCIFLAAVIVVNLIVNALPSKYRIFDTTAEDMFTFDEKTDSFIASVVRDVTVYHIYSEGMADPYLSEVLEIYSERNSHIKVEHLDQTKNPTFIEQHTDEQVTDNSMIVVSDLRSKYIPATDVYYIYCEMLGGRVDASTFQYYQQMYYQYYGQVLEYSQIFAGQNVVASGIDFVTKTDIPKAYVFSGHGAPSLNTTVSEWMKLQNYATEELALTDETISLDGAEPKVKEVPEDADMLIITGLTADITTAELGSITRYVKRGGDLLVMSHFSMAEFENLRTLAAVYGIDSNASLVIEGDKSHYTSNEFNIVGDGEQNTFAAGYSYPIYMPLSHGMKLSETMPEGMKGTVLVKTSDDAFAKKVGFDQGSTDYLTKQEGDVDGPFDLGVRVECEGAGTVIWLSSNYHIINETGDSSGRGARMLFEASVNDLCGGVETISLRTVEIGASYLNVTEGAASTWGIIVIGIIPLGFIGVGLFIWLRRRSK